MGVDSLLRSGPIRYARAERFAPPRVVASGDGHPVRAEISPQPRSRLESVMGPQQDLSAGEDCLQLSVVTPARDDGARPVVVFLHGGAFSSGAGVLDWYDGGPLAAQGDVVVVSVNYRLGALGFLCLDGVSEGNLGLLDQLAALRWVRDHVAAWGGDPADVTVMGQSAGGISIRLMLGMPQAQGLFRRAIVQSAPPARVARPRAEALDIGHRFAELLGADPWAADVETILTTQVATGAAHRELTGDPLALAFLPIVDGTQTGTPLARLDVDVLYGWNGDDSSAFRPDDPDVTGLTERTYAPTADIVAHWRAAGARTFGYRLDWRPRGSRFGATHCVELPLLLGSGAAWRDSPMLGDLSWSEVDEIGRRVRGAWLRFVRDGDPGPLPTPLTPVH